MFFKSITRCDYRYTHGWWVRIWWEKRNHTKFFSDTIHGGKRQALRQALDWRDTTEEMLGKPRDERAVYSAIKYASTASLGISYLTRRNYKYGHVCGYSETVHVTWYEGGKRMGTSFSIKKYGRTLALLLAEQHREYKLDCYRRRVTSVASRR
jgi:hypothetical protein